MAVGLFISIFSFIKLVTAEPESFIVGGGFVQSINRYPHVAFLSMTDKAQSHYTCGASILNQYLLITAAHCLDYVKQVTAYVGNIQRDQGTPHRVQAVMKHQKWNRVTLEHDIAMCRLQKPLKLGHTVKKVLLLKNPPISRNGHLASWGAVEENDYTDTKRLKHVVQKLWTHKSCKNRLYRLPEGTICGGDTDVRGFASKGDSGSGLIVKNQVVIGLVSYKDIAISRSLVVYTDLAYHYDWIVKVSKRLYCS